MQSLRRICDVMWGALTAFRRREQCGLKDSVVSSYYEEKQFALVWIHWKNSELKFTKQIYNDELQGYLMNEYNIRSNLQVLQPGSLHCYDVLESF